MSDQLGDMACYPQWLVDEYNRLVKKDRRYALRAAPRARVHVRHQGKRERERRLRQWAKDLRFKPADV